MWVVDELKSKGFTVGAYVKYVRGEKIYRIVSISTSGLVRIKMVVNGKLGNYCDKQAFSFLRGDIVSVKEANLKPVSQPLPYANRS